MSDSDDFVGLFDMDLNESFKRFAKPMIDTSLSFEETMERFLEDLPSRHKRDRRVQE